jgi:hypothetical protein
LICLLIFDDVPFTTAIKEIACILAKQAIETWCCHIIGSKITSSVEVKRAAWLNAS